MVAASRLTDALRAAGETLAGQRCVVALSGGPDSAVLAWLARRYGASARAVHIHHGWEGSERMAAAAGEVATTVGIRLDTVEVQPGAGPSPEGQAREARYGALFDAIQPGEVLLVGHTRTDQAETVLFNVSRGAGPRGVAGIPKRRASILRPLLEVDRRDIEAFVAQSGLPAVADPANADPALTRTRLRSLLPNLEEAVGAKVVAGLVRSGQIAAEHEVVLAEGIAAIRPVRRGDTIQLPLAVLNSLSDALRHQAVMEALRELRPYGGTAAELERLDALVEGGEAITELSDGFVAATSHTMLVMGPRASAPPPPIRWEPDGTTLWWGSWRLGGAYGGERPSSIGRGHRSVVFDAAGLAETPLTVRAATPEDRIAIGEGSKRVMDVISEGGVARPGRSGYPVVAQGEVVLWVPGLRRAALGWVSEATARYLCLRIVEEGAWKSERC